MTRYKEFPKVKAAEITVNDLTADTVTTNDLVISGVQSKYSPSSDASDHGVTGNNDTIKYYVDLASGNPATITLQHNNGAFQTTYNLDTDLTIPDNITLEVETGAVIDSVTGDETLTINGAINVGLWQIFGNTLTVDGNPKIEAIYPQWFGVDTANSGSINQSAFQRWADFICNYYPLHNKYRPKGIIPGFKYDIDGTIGFNGKGITIEAHGAKFNQTGTNTITVDLNTQYDNTGNTANHRNMVNWFGGYFTCSTSGNGGNTNIGIRMGDVARSEIAYVRGDNHGDCFILFAPQDTSSLRRIAGYNNYHHIRTDQCAGGPQDVNIKDISLSNSYSSGILIESKVNILAISDGCIIGSNALVIYPWEYPSASIIVDKIDFEQGSSLMYYIQELQTADTVNLQSMQITNCSFAHSYTLVGKFESVRTLDFHSNYIVSDQAGCLYFGTYCGNINIGPNRFPLTPSISYDCNRARISVYPYFVPVDYATLTGYDGNSFSTSNATLDMSAIFSEYPVLIEPKGYQVNVCCKDSGSSSGIAQAGITRASGTTINYGLITNVTYMPNDQRMAFSTFVPADSNGDLYRRFVATGTNTLEVWITVVGYAI